MWELQCCGHGDLLLLLSALAVVFMNAKEHTAGFLGFLCTGEPHVLLGFETSTHL